MTRDIVLFAKIPWSWFLYFLIHRGIVSWSFLWLSLPSKVFWDAGFLPTGQCVFLHIYRLNSPFEVIRYWLHGNLWLTCMSIYECAWGVPLSVHGLPSMALWQLWWSCVWPNSHHQLNKAGAPKKSRFLQWFYAAMVEGGMRSLETRVTVSQVSRKLPAQQVAEYKSHCDASPVLSQHWLKFICSVHISHFFLFCFFLNVWPYTLESISWKWVSPWGFISLLLKWNLNQTPRGRVFRNSQGEICFIW